MFPKLVLVVFKITSLSNCNPPFDKFVLVLVVFKITSLSNYARVV